MAWDPCSSSRSRLRKWGLLQCEVALVEIKTLGRTLKRRAADVLAYFEHPCTSNGSTEAINGRLEHLRGIALSFRNLTNYITRAPGHRQFQARPTPHSAMSPLLSSTGMATSPSGGCAEMH